MAHKFCILYPSPRFERLSATILNRLHLKNNLYQSLIKARQSAHLAQTTQSLNRSKGSSEQLKLDDLECNSLLKEPIAAQQKFKIESYHTVISFITQDAHNG